jgi:hypothetical protein
MVRIALWALRIYLLILLSLIGLKFTRILIKPKPASLIPAAVQPAASGPASAPPGRTNSSR